MEKHLFGRDVMSLTGNDLKELCSPSYLEGIGSASLAELRIRRDACQRAELVLSYLRRVVQGEVDLALAEIRQRDGGGRSDLASLVESLPTILATEVRSAGTPNHVAAPAMMTSTEIADMQQGLALEELLEQVLADEERTEGSLPGGVLPGANLCTFQDHELQEALDRLRRDEALLSSRRRVLHEHIEAFQAAIVERYKSGAADPDTLLR